MNEYDHEPIRGLPAQLPAGETILWQGAPGWQSMARCGFHVRLVAGYFVALALWGAATAPPGIGWGDMLLDVAGLALLAAGTVGVLTLLAWLSARTTVYTITTRRVVMRFGIALPISLNLPYRQIDSAGLRVHADGSGDIPLTLKQGQRIAYLVLWPHARPWRFKRAEPMLRAVPQAQAVAQILARALASGAEQPVPAMPTPSGMTTDGTDLAHGALTS